MTYALYDRGLRGIKRIPETEKGDIPSVIQLSKRQANGDSLVPGIKDIKLKHWFPEMDVEAYKIRLWKDKKGEIHLPYGLPLNKISAIFAEPASMDLNAFSIPEYNGCHRMKQVFDDIGIEVTPSTKLPKRLKRALLVACIAGASDISIMVTPDDALPVPFIDGCFLINLKTARKMLPDKDLKAYDTVQASCAWSEGLAKGTAILMPNLAADVIVQECNLKREAKFKSNPKPLLAIEQIHHSRVPCSDMQTIVNLGATEALRKVLNKHISKLEAIGGNPAEADRWYQDEFFNHDWYRSALRAHLEKGKPMPDTMPPLSRAKEAGIERVSMTPVLKQLTYLAACKAVDIRELKARFHPGEAIAGYIIPDVSRIDSRGYLKENEEELGDNQITVPWGKGTIAQNTPVVCTRNPNAWREVAVKVIADRKKYRSRTACQISLSDCMNPSLNGRMTLENWGGADMDDSICVWAHPDMLAAAMQSEREAEENDIPFVDLEGYIDAAVQHSDGYSLDLGGQMALAGKDMPLHLGQIVNFFMNLRSVKVYEWYKRAAACKDLHSEYDSKGNITKEGLRNVWDQYNMLGEENCFFADVFCPEDPDEFDPKARVPRSGGQYVPHVEVLTDLGEVVREYGQRFEEILVEEEQSHILHKGNMMWTVDAMMWLQNQVKHDAAKNRAIALEWAWKAMTSQYAPNPLSEKLQPLVEGFDFESIRTDQSDEGLRLKKKAWGKICGKVLTGDPEKDRQIIAWLARLMIGPERRFNREVGRFLDGQFGIDRILWNPTLNEEGFEIPGVPELWCELVFDYEAELNPEAA